MEARALVASAHGLLGKLDEVLCCPRRNVLLHLHHNATQGLSIPNFSHADVKVDKGICLDVGKEQDLREVGLI